jgi:hypothetical protein
MSALFIIHNSEDGLRCERIAISEFQKWMHDRTDGVMPARHPCFVTSMPTETSPETEYLVVHGTVITPNPISRVTEWELPVSR